ncbi:MAG: hypothetical protein AB8H80_01050 [Planctomycetota bacterium]
MTTDRADRAAADAAQKTVADHDYVMPKAPREHGELLVVGDRESDAAGLTEVAGIAEAVDHPAHTGGANGAVARAFGARFGLHAESLALLLGEVRGRIDELDSAVAEDSRAQLQGAVRKLGELLGWCEVVRDEIAQDSRYGRAGCEPIDGMDICRAAAAASFGDAVAVRGDEDLVVWGRRDEYQMLVESALKVVWERLGCRGALALQVGWIDGSACFRVQGRGPAQVDRVDAELLDALRVNAERCRAIIAAARPFDEQATDRGPQVEMVLRLPVGTTAVR